MSSLLIPASSELNDPGVVGKHYVGVGDIGYGSAGLPLRYGFILIPDDTRNWNVATGGKQVVLNLAPKSISISEPAATTIQPTQNSGKYVERRGQIIKDINLSGTTAFNFNPQIPHSARSAIPQSVIVETEGPYSGMGRFLELRNLFREYWAIFSDANAIADGSATRARFVFINEKEDEAWIVEPMAFRMIRTAPSNKFTYNYEITMQTICPLEDIGLVDDPITLFEKVANVKNIVRQSSNQLSQFGSVIGKGMAFAVGALKEASDALQSVITNIATDLGLIADGVKSVIEIPEVITGRAEAGEASFMSAAEEFLSIRDSETATSGDDPVPSDNISVDGVGTGSSSQPLSVSVDEALVGSMSEIGKLSGRAELFSKSFPDTWKEVLDLYNPNYGFGGYNRLLVDAGNNKGVKEAQILPGDDLLNIAIKELGNAERFQEIAVLNKLKPPYISPTKTDRLANTLAPGDPILIPSQGATASTKMPIQTTIYTDPTFTGAAISSTADTVKLDTGGKFFRLDQWKGFTIEIIKGTGVGQIRKVSNNTADNFGVDNPWDVLPTSSSVVRIYLIRLGTKPQKSANEQMLGVDALLTNRDVTISQQGDIALVEGLSNLKQAIDIKFRTKPGELSSHPGFGLAFEPGRKAVAETLLSYRVAARQLLRSDPRILAVDKLTVSADGDILTSEGYVVAASGSHPFAVNTSG